MALLVLYIGLALAFSFLCSVAEAVLLSVTPAFIGSLEQAGNPTAHLLRKQKENVDRPLTAILSLNTIAHTIGAAGAGAQAAAVFGNRWVGLASVILTFLILVFSEIIPKTIGAVYWRSLAPVTARGLRWLVFLVYPLVKMGEWITSLISKDKTSVSFEREEFGALAELGTESGELHQRDSQIVKNLLQFESLRLSDVMTPRTVLQALAEDDTVEATLARTPRLPFSRLPLYRKDLDNITGFVLKTDLLLAQAEGRGIAPLRELARDIAALPGQFTLRQGFDILLQRRQHILLILDEYGGTAGVVTLEDVVETLLGLEIMDEADRAEDMQELARRQWRLRAERLGLLGDSDTEGGKKTSG